mgnify:FL=1
MRYALTATEYITGMKEKEMTEIPNYFKIAEKIIERAQRGIPQDRWMRGDHEMKAFVKAYIEIVDTCAEMHKEIIKRGVESMSIDPENT